VEDVYIIFIDVYIFLCFKRTKFVTFLKTFSKKNSPSYSVCKFGVRSIWNLYVVHSLILIGQGRLYQNIILNKYCYFIKKRNLDMPDPIGTFLLFFKTGIFCHIVQIAMLVW